MSLFENIKLTNNGLNLQSKAQVGKMLKFTNIKIGDGKIGSTPVSTITDLKNFKLTIELNKFKVLTDGQAVIGGILSNTSVTEGFYWREIGLYAEDPDTGLEILYAYGNCGDLAEFIPAVDSNTIIEKVVNIIILTSNMENVTASINNSLVYLSLDGDSSNTTVTFTESEEKTDIESGDKLSVLFGKIKKWLTSLATVAFSGKFADLKEVPSSFTPSSHSHSSSEITETDPTVPEHVKNISTTDITDWNLKQNAITSSTEELEPGVTALATGQIHVTYE